VAWLIERAPAGKVLTVEAQSDLTRPCDVALTSHDRDAELVNSSGAANETSPVVPWVAPLARSPYIDRAFRHPPAFGALALDSLRVAHSALRR